jgi:hypothetical protein
LYVGLALAIVARCESPKHQKPADLSPAKIEKLKAISEKYQGSLHKGDVTKLGTAIAKAFSDDADERDVEASPLLAIPFVAPPGDAAAEKAADSAFAMAYGRVAISHRGQVGLSKDPLPSRELGAALERARASHST